MLPTKLTVAPKPGEDHMAVHYVQLDHYYTDIPALLDSN